MLIAFNMLGNQLLQYIQQRGRSRATQYPPYLFSGIQEYIFYDELIARDEAIFLQNLLSLG